MSEECLMTEGEFHRQEAIRLFNHVWKLMENPSRSVEQDDEMIHAAHASRLHWGIIGQPVNLARGEQQVSRVYAVLGRSEPSLYHAQRCLDICVENNIGDFDLAFAYEALARAHAIAGNSSEYREFLESARMAGDLIAEQDDKEFLFNDLKTIPVLN